MSKRKVVNRLDQDEVAIVGKISDWEHLISVYEALAEDGDEFKEGWLELAAWIRYELEENRPPAVDMWDDEER